MGTFFKENKAPEYVPSKKDLHQKYLLEDGTIVPSTTEVINWLGGSKVDALMGWQKNLLKKGIDPDRLLTYFADLGTFAHALVEEHIQKQLGNEDFVAINPYEYSQEIIDNAQNGITSFLQWEDNNDVEYQQAEEQLVSEQYRYGGTIDIVATVNGVPKIIDLKTSNSVYDSHIIQSAAYWNLYKENKDEDREVTILRIGKTEVLYLEHDVTKSMLELNFNTFWHLRKIYDNMKVS